MTTKIIDQLRTALRPRGSMDVVHLNLTTNHFSLRFVEDCINEIEKSYVVHALGQPFSNLERLALLVLLDSAGINKESISKEIN